VAEHSPCTSGGSALSETEMCARQVLVVQPVGYRGGAGTMLANMISAANGARYQFSVVCPPGDMTTEFVKMGARVTEVPRPIAQLPHYTGNSYWFGDPRFLAAAISVTRSLPWWRAYFQDCRPDVIQLNVITLAPLLYACRPSGARVICVVQETAVRGLLNVRTSWFHRLLSRMDGVMFISEYDRRNSNCRARVVDVIPNWVKIERQPTHTDLVEARKHLGLPVNARIVLMMGGISRLKGTATLVAAAAHLDDIPNLLVCIAGYDEPAHAPQSTLRTLLGLSRPARTPEGERVIRSLEKHGLERRVRLIGMRSDVRQLYVAADVVVFPASRPHQARPVLEAGAAAKPVVVSDFPNLAEFVCHERNGLTFAPDDPGALAGQLRRLLLDPELARRLGIRNWENTRAQHDAETNGRRYLQFLDRVVGTGAEEG